MHPSVLLTFDCTITQMEDIGRNCADREVPSDGLSLYGIPYTQRQAKQFNLVPSFYNMKTSIDIIIIINAKIPIEVSRDSLRETLSSLMKTTARLIMYMMPMTRRLIPIIAPTIARNNSNNVSIYNRLLSYHLTTSSIHGVPHIEEVSVWPDYSAQFRQSWIIILASFLAAFLSKLSSLHIQQLQGVPVALYGCTHFSVHSSCQSLRGPNEHAATYLSLALKTLLAWCLLQALDLFFSIISTYLND